MASYDNESNRPPSSLDELARGVAEIQERLAGIAEEIERLHRLAKQMESSIEQSRSAVENQKTIGNSDSLTVEAIEGERAGIPFPAQEKVKRESPISLEAETLNRLEDSDDEGEETGLPLPPSVSALPEPRATRPTLDIWVDGSCLGNPGPGGWAYLLKDERGRVREQYGSAPGKTTNNRMEMQALIEALKALQKGAKKYTIRVITDSSYLRGLADGRYKATKNKEQVEELRELISQFPSISFHQVLGHSGVQENERVDLLAREAAARVNRK